MDDRNVATWVGALALGLVLAAVAWLLVAPVPRMSGAGQAGPGDRQVSRTLSVHPHSLEEMQLCIDASAIRGLPGCVAASFVPSLPTPSAHRAQRAAGQAPAGVTPPPSQVPAVSAPATPPPATVQPAVFQPADPPSSAPPSSTPPPPTSPPSAPTRRPVPHKGPVPGGNTTPPHTGPRP
jgi:hypothetical protein